LYIEVIISLAYIIFHTSVTTCTLTCPLDLAHSVSGFLSWVPPALLSAEVMASAVNRGATAGALSPQSDLK